MRYQDYFDKMVEDGRFAVIAENGIVVLCILYSICEDPEPYLSNLDYKFIPHDPSGKTLVIEAAIGNDLKFSFRDKIEEIFCAKFPQLEKAMWRRRRKPVDKTYTIWRRHAHAFQH